MPRPPRPAAASFAFGTRTGGQRRHPRTAGQRLRHRQVVRRPPSTARTAPVMYDAAELARKTTALAHSSSCPARPAGTRAAIVERRYSSEYSAVISDGKKPGTMVFTRMPRRPVHCWARSRESPSIAALLDEYAACGRPAVVEPRTLPTLMMLLPGVITRPHA